MREFRLASKAKTTNGYAKVPHLFAQITQPEGVPFLLIPRVSSEHRRYIPIGYMAADVIASDAVQILPGATLTHFGVLTSSVHMAYVRATAGRLKSDYRYSKEIVYNTFPWPEGMNVANVKMLPKPNSNNQLELATLELATLPQWQQFPRQRNASLTLAQNIPTVHLRNCTTRT